MPYRALPPKIKLSLLTGLFIFWTRYRRLFKILILVFVLAFYLLSTPLVASLLGHLLQDYPPLELEATSRAQAIVVLGGGRRHDAPEYGGADALAAGPLIRAQYAARLARQTGLPLLASGGRSYGSVDSEADLLAGALEQDFSTPVRWRESRSRNTWQNALYSGEILKAEGIDTILLVTQAWHMPRALWAFRQQGLGVIAAPTDFAEPWRARGLVWGLLPSLRALSTSRWVLREVQAMWAYKLLYGRN